MSDRRIKRKRKRSTRKQRVVLMAIGCITLVLAVMLLAAYLLSGNGRLKWVSIGYMVVGAAIIVSRAVFANWDARAKRKYTKR